MSQSYPNPNIDGIAYIDDFEGSRDAYSLGVFREFWKFSSRPAQLSEFNLRARTTWYNPFEQIPTKEIWDQETAPGEGLTHVLTMKFENDLLDRRAGKLDSGLTLTNPADSWGGIMRPLPGGAAYQDRAQLLEIRVKGNTGVLNIDLGKISEDIDGDGEQFNEDMIDNILNSFGPEEDIGLDQMNDAEERAHYGEDVDDPSGDNWAFDPDAGVRINYDGINGTENNIDDPGTFGKSDSEDLDRDNVKDFVNDYYTFSIDLSDPFNRFKVDSSENIYGWKTYRIPIRDSSIVEFEEGDPSWSRIEFVRLWMQYSGVDVCSLSIASLDIISSNWEDTLIVSDSIVAEHNWIDEETPKFNVAVINDRENVDYTSPPGIEGHYNKTSGITETEQSLLMHFENFRAYDSLVSDTGIAYRYFLSTLNLLGYRKMEMFVHGPTASLTDSLMYFYRIGQDSLNFYEISKMLEPGWENNTVDIDFDELTGLKEYLLRAQKDNPDTNQIIDTIGNQQYRVFGKPDITRVKYIANGVYNLNKSQPITGDVWIDELRVTEVRRDVGMAARISVSGNVADLFTYNFGYTYQNEFFRKISASTRGGSNNNLGSGKATRSFSTGINFKLDKFLPKSFGARIPISARYQKNRSTPRLRVNSDIILPEEIRDEESTVSTTTAFSISESFNKKTKNPLFTAFLNKFKTSFSVSRSEGRSPTSPMSISENMRFNSSYSFNIGKPPSFRPFFWTKPIPLLNKLSENNLYLFINTFSAKGDFSRSLRITRNSKDVLTNSYSRDFKGDMRVGYRLFDNLTANYSFNTRRDLTDPETVNFVFSSKDFKFGVETNYSQNFGLSYTPVIFTFLTHKANFSASYREDLNIRTNTRNASLSKSYNLSGVFDHKKLLSGKSKKKRKVPQKRNRGNSEDVTKVEPDKNVIAKLVGPPSKVMLFLTSWVNAFNYEFKESYTYSVIGMSERAQMKFRFGLTDEVGAALDSSATTTGRSNTIKKATSYALRSGTTFLGGLKTDVNYSKSIREDVKSTFNPQKTEAINFPDINFTLRNFTTFRFLNPIVKKFNPKFKYARSTNKTIDLNTGIVRSDKISTAMNPLLSFSIKMIKGMVINFKTSKTITESNGYSPSDGSLSTTNTSTTTNTTISTKYSFSWPRGFNFPILGRLKIKSTLSVSVDVTMRGQKNEELNLSSNIRQLRERNDLMISPSISYSFSSQIRGGITGRWQDTEDKTQSKKSFVRELRMWVDIRF